jgi:hypothetical protein
MEVENLTFYHGTGAYFAERILRYGSDDDFLVSIGAFDVRRRILKALREVSNLDASSDWQLLTHFSCPGSDYSGLWYPALKHLETGDKLNYEYGAVFVTLNLSNAYRYALNPQRSEFCRAVSESLKVLAAGIVLRIRLLLTIPSLAIYCRIHPSLQSSKLLASGLIASEKQSAQSPSP